MLYHNFSGFILVNNILYSTNITHHLILGSIKYIAHNLAD